MTRRVKDFYRAVAQLEHLAVFRLVNGEISLCIRTENDRCTGGLGEIEMSADKISVEVRFKNILDRRIPLFRQTQIGIDIAQGVDDGRLPFIINIISRFTETTSIQLLNEHNLAFLAKLSNHNQSLPAFRAAGLAH